MRDFHSILLSAPEAERLVEPFRLAGDWSRAHGVPPHLTLAGPWPLSVDLPFEALRKIAAEVRGTHYRLDAVGTLGDALCLFPGDDEELLRWRAAILAAVGAADAIDDDWRLHLTVCRGADSSRLADIEAAVRGSLPLACEVRRLLYAQMTTAGAVTVQPL